jgi:hypothetical protein
LVFGIGDYLQPCSQNGSFQFDYAENSANPESYSVTADYTGDEAIPSSGRFRLTWSSVSGPFSTPAAVAEGPVTDIAPDTTVRVNWGSESGEESAVLASEATPASQRRGRFTSNWPDHETAEIHVHGHYTTV